MDSLNTKRIATTTGLGCLLLGFLCAGCVRRIEIIALLPDGSVSLVTHIEGDPEDVELGDAIPAKASGWGITERVEEDKEHKKTLHRAATRYIGAGEALPAGYAPPGSDLASSALAFPTQISIEQSSDGTYYHFRRTYRAREWARVNYWRKRILESDALKDIAKKAPNEVTSEERRELATALVKFEAAKMTAFFDAAAQAVNPPLPQTLFLSARQSYEKVFQAEELVDRVQAMLDPDSDQAGNKLNTLVNALRDRAWEQVARVLEEHNLPGSRAAALLDERDAVQQTYLVTEDLGDESWDVVVILPGKIVGHNAGWDKKPETLDLDEFASSEEEADRALGQEIGKLHYAPGFSTITWSFNGEALHDRDVLLMATSFVPRDAN